MLSLTSKYALRALVHLAEKPDVFSSIEPLSQAIGVPGPYLAKLMKTLSIKGVVVTKKGLNGGVMLPESSKKTTFFEICAALEDPVVRESCFIAKEKCEATNPCPMHKSWSKVRREMQAMLRDSTLGVGSTKRL